MTKFRYNDSQILAILKQVEARMRVPKPCGERSMSLATFLICCAASMVGKNIPLMRGIKEVKDDNRRLKKMFDEERRRAEILEEARMKNSKTIVQCEVA